MKKINIKLSCGRPVEVEAFIYQETYAGLIHGSPGKEDNKRFFEQATYPENWGERKVLKLKPPDIDFNNRLKPACYIAWLHSHDPINPEYHGSSLIVIWFDDEPDDKSIEGIVTNGVKSVDWDSNAQDFYY